MNPLYTDNRWIIVNGLLSITSVQQHLSAARLDHMKKPLKAIKAHTFLLYSNRYAFSPLRSFSFMCFHLEFITIFP